MQNDQNIIDAICVVKSASSQRILDSNRTVVAPIDYQDILKMQGIRGLPLEPYLWRQHSSVNSSPGQCRCRAVSRWRALPARRPLLVSPVAADKIIS